MAANVSDFNKAMDDLLWVAAQLDRFARSFSDTGNAHVAGVLNNYECAIRLAVGRVQDYADDQLKESGQFARDMVGNLLQAAMAGAIRGVDQAPEGEKREA